MMSIFRRLRIYDRLTVGYLFLVLIFLAISPQPPAAAQRISLVHAAAIFIVLALAHYGDRFGTLRVFHDFYPLLLFTVIFAEFTQLSTVLFPYWMEPLLIKFDYWIFGMQTQQWTATHLSPFAIEFLAFAYWSYYLLIPGTLFLVYKKNYPQELINACNQLCLTMYACYIIFMLSPARGPHHAFLPANGALLIEGGFFTNLVRDIQRFGSVHGAAFPSSHVAVAWAMFFVLQRRYRKIAWLAGILIAALTLSVITIGYHFSLDAIGGVVLAFGINAAWKDEKASTISSPYLADLEVNQEQTG